MLCDTLYARYPNANFGKHYASICYDQVKNTEKALNLLLDNYNRGVDVFQRPRKEEFIWTEELVNSPAFQALCPDYNGGYIVPPAESPELRDALLELLIWTMDQPEKNQFKYLNAEKYFLTNPNWDKDNFTENVEKKFDRLVERYGFPTAAKVGERMCLVVTMSIIIHSPNVDFMEKYQADVRRVFGNSTQALLHDKISVFKRQPQKYGTQQFYSKEQEEQVFYPMENPQKIDEVRLQMGLDILEKYANFNGVNIDTKFNKEFN